MTDVRKNFLITLASSNANMVINFVGAMFLARLLTPYEIGVFSVAYVFSGLLRTIREMGLGTYIVQEQELSPARFRTAFGISLVLAAITGGIVAALAVPAGIFFREPGITQALYVIAASFLLVPFGATTMSLLRRDLRFTDIAVITTIGTLAQNVSAILLAWAGHSFMSLAWSSMIGIGATILAVIFYRPADLPWLPSLAEWRRVLGFSSYVSGSALVSYANNFLSDLVLGRMLNMEAVALFNRGKGLSDLVVTIVQQAVNSVSLPYFSQALREGRCILAAYVHTSALYNAFALPMCAIMAVAAEPVILVLFGEQWTSSAPILEVTCLAIALTVPTALTPQVLTAYGEVRAQFKLDAQSLTIKLILVIACAPLGLVAVAWGYALASLLATALRLRRMFKLCHMRLGDLLDTLRPAVVPTALSVIGPLLVENTLALPPFATLFLSGVTGGAGALAGIMLTRNRIREELLLLLRKQKKAA